MSEVDIQFLQVHGTFSPPDYPFSRNSQKHVSIAELPHIRVVSPFDVTDYRGFESCGQDESILRDVHTPFRFDDSSERQCLARTMHVFYGKRDPDSKWTSRLRMAWDLTMHQYGRLMPVITRRNLFLISTPKPGDILSLSSRVGYISRDISACHRIELNDWQDVSEVFRSFAQIMVDMYRDWQPGSVFALSASKSTVFEAENMVLAYRPMIKD